MFSSRKYSAFVPPQKDCFFQGKKVLKPQKFNLLCKFQWVLCISFNFFCLGDPSSPGNFKSLLWVGINIFCNFTFAQARERSQRTIAFHGGHGSFLELAIDLIKIVDPDTWLMYVKYSYDSAMNVCLQLWIIINPLRHGISVPLVTCREARAEWWDHLPPTSISQVQILAWIPYVGWFVVGSALPCLARFSPLFKNHHFRIPVRLRN